jgi:hypothetical protein
MGRLADAALRAGGKVTFVLPQFMDELEWGNGRLPNFAWPPACTGASG